MTWRIARLAQKLAAIVLKFVNKWRLPFKKTVTAIA
jgi:hypothetical protein